MNPKITKGKSLLQLDFLPRKKFMSGLVWYGLVNILCWFSFLNERISICDGSIWGTLSRLIQQWSQISWKLNKTADLSKELAVTLVPFDEFQHVKGQFGVSWPIELWAQISCTLYKTADIQRIITITLVPFDRFQLVKGKFGVVFSWPI